MGDREGRGPRAGWFCAYTPLEVLLAAGLEPVRLFGSEVPTPNADSILGTNICPYVRACLEQGLAGEAPGAVIFAGCCDGMRRLYDAWRRYCNPDFAYAFDLPRSGSERSIALYRAGIRGLIKAVEMYTARQVTAGRLAGAITWRWKAEKDVSSVTAGMRSGARSGEDALRAYEDLQSGRRAVPPEGEDEAPRCGQTAGPGSREARVKVAVTGNILRREGITRVLESLGARVVMLDLCSAERSLVWEEGPGELAGLSLDELIDLVVRRYLGKLACPRMLDVRDRHDRVVARLRDSGARAVVAAPLMFCDPFLYDLPALEERLDREGLPVLVLSSDYGDQSDGQTLTRLEAFLEMV